MRDLTDDPHPAYTAAMMADLTARAGPGASAEGDCVDAGYPTSPTATDAALAARRRTLFDDIILLDEFGLASTEEHVRGRKRIAASAPPKAAPVRRDTVQVGGRR